MTYTQVPTAGQFQKDTSISFAFRKDDAVLKHLDWLLESLRGRNALELDATRYAVLADLFMTCNFWIKSYHEGNKRMRKERYPAVVALFEVVVSALCTGLQCNRPGLAARLGEIYGRDMHQHGIQVDFESQQARYISKLEREMYRVRFKNGMAYQCRWWKGEGTWGGLVAAESKHAYSAIARRGADGVVSAASKNFGCFVMTVERELYMAKPELGTSTAQNGFFHSSFTGGDMVTMAGTMLIKGGAIRGIRADSGHYKPTMTNMGLLLQGLAMYNVDLSRIVMYGWDETNLGSASEFIKFHMSWDQFERQRMAELGNRQDSDERRQRINLQPRFPNLPPRVAPAIPLVDGVMPGRVAPTGNADLYNA